MAVDSKRYLFVATLLAPALMLLLGLWQVQRGEEFLTHLQGERAALETVLEQMKAASRVETSGINTNLQFRRDGQNYVGTLAVDKAREAAQALDAVIQIATYRRLLPPVVVAVSGAVLVVNLLVIASTTLLALVGRRSRPALLHSFVLVRRLLPPTLIALVVLTALAAIAAVLFETSALIQFDDIGHGAVYLIGAALFVVAISLVTAFQALSRLGSISALFVPEPYDLVARRVSRREAPGLFSLVQNFATRIGAPMPETIAIGLMQGFFVISGPVRLLPEDIVVRGNTLHLSLGHLALLGKDETSAIISHELAHFAGEDTAYSERFLPVYNGFGHSLDAVAEAGRAKDGSLSFLASPALSLGYYVLERFHLTVQHWSRIREFEADAKSAHHTSKDIAGRALLRHGAASEVVDPTIAETWTNPAAAPADLVPLIIERARQSEAPAADFAMDQAMPHPMDSHPPNSKRLEAFGFPMTRNRLAEARTIPASEPSPLADYFVEPQTISSEVTEGFLHAAQRSVASQRDVLVSMAASVSQDVVELHENATPVALLLFGLAAIITGLAAWALVLGLMGSANESVYIGGGFVLVGLFFAVLGIRALARARKPFLRLYPDRLEHRHLDRPIKWSDLRSLSVANRTGTAITTLLLKHTVPFPKRVGGMGRVDLNPGGSMLTFSAVPPRHLKVQGYAELIYSYAEAAAARRALEQETTH